MIVSKYAELAAHPFSDYWSDRSVISATVSYIVAANTDGCFPSLEERKRARIGCDVTKYGRGV